MSMTYQEHIDKLAAELGVDVVQNHGMPGMMFVEYEPPVIEGPIIEDPPKNAGGYIPYKYPSAQACYLVMLHELGHVYHGHTQGRPPYEDKTFYFDNGVLRSEAQAWEYALDNRIDEPLLDSSRVFMWRTCLGSYYRGSEGNTRKDNQLWNGNRHYVKFAYDKPDDYFWGIKTRMESD